MAAFPSLTVVILTLNEASRIQRCLLSLPQGVKAVVLDSFSSDGTLKVALETWQQAGHAAKDLVLVSRSWPGFTEARNQSLDWVQSEWVLWLDADEWLHAALVDFLRTLHEPRWAHTGLFRLPRLSVFLGREIRHGGWFPDRKARLGRASLLRWRSGPLASDVHEDLELRAEGWEQKELPPEQCLGHEPFRDRAEQEATNEHYSTLLAQGLAQKWLQKSGHTPPGRLWRFYRVGIKFVENYFWKGGFLDGRPGWVIACGSAKSMRLRLEKATRLFYEKRRS